MYTTFMWTSLGMARRFHLFPSRRLRISRTTLAISIILLIILIRVYFRLYHDHSDSTHDSLVKCHYPKEMQKKLEKLLLQVIDIIKHQLKAPTYFLCYDSLWGALKQSSPLPWRSNQAELCLLNDEVGNLDESFVFRAFKRHNLYITYHSSEGYYIVHEWDDTGLEQSPEPFVKLVLFELDTMTGDYRRVGWKHRLLPPDTCDKLHCFPPRLIIDPLPRMKFMNHEMPVPREEIELQKYLYPESWWKDVTPEKCKKSHKKDYDS